MPKIQIDVPQVTYDKLKKYAKEKYQSMRGFITYHLIEYMENPDRFINLSNLSEGTTIRTTVPRTQTPEEIREQKLKKFQALAKKIVGHELDEEDYCLGDFESDNSYYDKSVEEPIRERVTRHVRIHI